jgi:hypothetical protein
MQETNGDLQISSNRATEQTLRTYLARRHYPPILKYVESQLGGEIRTDQSGNTFERCIDWCAQHGGKYEDVKTIVLKLYELFYFDLPEDTRLSFDEMAAEVGFATSKGNMEQRRLSGSWAARALGIARGFRKISTRKS